ncbi:hypothetical protein MRB53_028707 [Persea americana]|uniref:Uncharacterized protein n=1 Tax=Persea americana TaxID=3435 RepID=A0ACC2KGP9_PERAE|nr:hypothetical protein MRB53_028707 [Persea americana]
MSGDGEMTTVAQSNRLQQTDSDSPFFSVRELHQRRGRLPPLSAAIAPSPDSRKEKVAVLDSSYGNQN